MQESAIIKYYIKTRENFKDILLPENRGRSILVKNVDFGLNSSTIRM